MNHSKCNVVVVLYNSESTLSGLVDGLVRNQTYINQVIFVDNDSKDSTLDVLNALLLDTNINFEILRSNNVGFSVGVNKGSSALKRSQLPTLCLNPDVELQPGALESMLSTMNSMGKTGIVTAPLVGENGLIDSASIRLLPTLGGATLYGIFGKLLPKKLKYNNRDQTLSFVTGNTSEGPSLPVQIEATTGALMLVNPHFRNAGDGIFDETYWMYGEDLQLCRDAAAEGWAIYMALTAPSLHIKGVSSGWPRSYKSNVEFHKAMKHYYLKNLKRGGLVTLLVVLGIYLRLCIAVSLSLPTLAKRKFST